MEGYVYVLTNPAMPDLVKVGRSKHAAGARAKQLYNGDTGVPLPFEVHFECFFKDCVEGEALVHEELQEHRINPNREFFKVEPWEAQRTVLSVCAGYIDETIANPDFMVCEAEMALLAYKLDLYPPEPYLLVNYVSDAAWLEAYEVYKKRFPKNFVNRTPNLRIVASGEK